MVLCELLGVEVLVVWGCVGCFAVTTCVGLATVCAGLATVSLLLLTTAVLSCVVMVIVALSCGVVLIVALSCAVVFCVVVQTVESGSIYVWSIRRPPSLLNRPLLSSINKVFASGAVSKGDVTVKLAMRLCLRSLTVSLFFGQWRCCLWWLKPKWQRVCKCMLSCLQIYVKSLVFCKLFLLFCLYLPLQTK